MKTLFKATKAALVFPLLVVASQASAHGVESKTVLLPVIGSGSSYELTHTCSHGKAFSGGFSDDSGIGTLDVTGSYPSTTDTWVIELSNRSGRPTGAQEVNATISVLCGVHGR